MNKQFFLEIKKFLAQNDIQKKFIQIIIFECMQTLI